MSATAHNNIFVTARPQISYHDNTMMPYFLVMFAFKLYIYVANYCMISGRAYVERYSRSFQTRDVFTIWGILQLLRRYPGRLRDLDLMFNCNDHPGIMKGKTYANLTAPPPLFGYCQRQGTVGLIFPDWSFWGW